MKQITIYDLLPLLRPGFCVMDEEKCWWYYSGKPELYGNCMWTIRQGLRVRITNTFNIKPFDGDWKDSLMECGK